MFGSNAALRSVSGDPTYSAASREARTLSGCFEGGMVVIQGFEEGLETERTANAELSSWGVRFLKNWRILVAVAMDSRGPEDNRAFNSSSSKHPPPL